jgi:hypothetical protein
LDIARWHATCSWLDDPALEPVVLSRSGTERIHPHDDPMAVLDAALEGLRQVGAEQDWRIG